MTAIDSPRCGCPVDSLPGWRRPLLVVNAPDDGCRSADDVLAAFRDVGAEPAILLLQPDQGQPERLTSTVADAVRSHGGDGILALNVGRTSGPGFHRRTAQAALDAAALLDLHALINPCRDGSRLTLRRSRQRPN